MVLTRRTPGRARHLARAAAVLGLAATAVLAGAGTASAHAVLESTDPHPDVVLVARPPAVSLTFGESVQLPPGGLRVFGPDGDQVDDGRAAHPDGAGNIVAVGLQPGSAVGSYTVAWRVISADTHPVAGAFTFSVGHPSAAPRPTTAPAGSPVVGVVYALVRAVAYGSWAALSGAVIFLLFCRPPQNARSVAVRVAATGWFGLVVTSVATLLLQGPYGDGTGLSSVFDYSTIASTLELPLGTALEERLLLLLGTAVYLGWLFRQPPEVVLRPRTSTIVTVVVLVGGLATTWASAGHSAFGLEPGLALPADVAHLVAMGAWLGGLAVLAVALRRPGSDDPDDLAGAVGRFSPIALWSVVVLVGTGTYQSWRQMGSWSAFADTAYGEILLAKLVAVGAILAVAATSRRAVRQMVPAGGAAADAEGATATALLTLRRSVLLESLGGVVVLVLVAALVNSEPGRTAEANAPATAAAPVAARLPYDTGGPRGSGTLDVTVDPARTGPDVVEVTVRDPSGAVLDPAELDLAFSLPDRNLGPLRLTTERQAPGEYTAAGQLPIAGLWQLAVTVRTSEVDETTVRLPVPIR